VPAGPDPAPGTRFRARAPDKDFTLGRRNPR
jgi:hypothetical protein